MFIAWPQVCYLTEQLIRLVLSVGVLIEKSLSDYRFVGFAGEAVKVSFGFGLGRRKLNWEMRWKSLKVFIRLPLSSPTLNIHEDNIQSNWFQLQIETKSKVLMSLKWNPTTIVPTNFPSKFETIFGLFGGERKRRQFAKKFLRETRKSFFHKNFSLSVARKADEVKKGQQFIRHN